MTNSLDADGEWPAGGLETLGACPVCGCTETSAIYGGLHDRAFRAAPGTWTLVRCDGCRSAYLDPRPTRETIGLAYRSYYTHGADAQAPPSVGALRQGLANDYRRARWGYDQGHAIPGGRLIPRVAPSRGALVDREIRHLPADSRREGCWIVGCGSGAFLAQMAALGWRAQGIDPDPEAVASAREAGPRRHAGDA